jgi:rRNA-processing protein FCF1
VSTLVVDAANVIGARPNGWWRDRAGAARRLVEALRAATTTGVLDSPVLVVLEGRARAGAVEGLADGVEVIHAGGAGDETIVALVTEGGGPVVVVSADRELRRRVQGRGAEVVGPNWLLDLLGA